MQNSLSMFWVCLMIVALLPGCSGCQRDLADGNSGATKKKSEQIVARLTADPIRMLPATNGSEVLLMKPGHWYEIQQPVKANLDDESMEVTCNVVDQLFHPLSMLGLREPISFGRSISLARGQQKRLDYQVFVPTIPPAIIDKETTVKPSIRLNYMPRGLGASISEAVYPITPIPDYQYYLISLSKSSDRYQFLEGSSACVWPSEGKLDDEKVYPFRLVNIEESDVAASLPSRINTWSSTSHLLWNDCSSTALNPSQQQAILDWLHFGGQIIVNGPEAESSLANSFLSEYLPFKNIGSGESVAVDWEAFNSKWSISTKAGEKGDPLSLPTDRIVPTASGNLADGARWVEGCEGIAAERMVGAGRIVLTTFPIGESTWIRWPSYSSFFNAVLLGRPPRVWATDSFQTGDMVFAEPYRGYEKDPTLSSRFRLLARDLGARTVTLETPTRSSIDRSLHIQNVEIPAITAEAENESNARRIRDGETGGRRGVGELSSQAALSRVAGRMLRDASGINVPSIATIIKLLLTYLVFLVPVNWLVFKLIGRVEWAWAAAPLIAVVGAFAVARAVQLDVGFSRSQTVLSIVEVPAGYHRGYAASFTSLYTSLSTNYSAFNPDGSGFVLPMVTREERQLSFSRDTTSTVYRYASDRGEGLESFPVRSNSTSFLRVEQPCDIDGTLSLNWAISNEKNLVEVTNNTSSNLSQMGLVAMNHQGQFLKAWVGDFQSGSKSTIPMDIATIEDDSSDRPARIRKLDGLWLDGWGDKGPARGFGETGRRPIGNDPMIRRRQQQRRPDSLGSNLLLPAPVVRTLIQNHLWAPEEILLIAVSDRSYESLTIAPNAMQQQRQSIMIVRSPANSIGNPTPDINLPSKSNVESLDREEHGTDTPTSPPNSGGNQ